MASTKIKYNVIQGMLFLIISILLFLPLISYLLGKNKPEYNFGYWVLGFFTLLAILILLGAINIFKKGIAFEISHEGFILHEDDLPLIRWQDIDKIELKVDAYRFKNRISLSNSNRAEFIIVYLKPDSISRLNLKNKPLKISPSLWRISFTNLHKLFVQYCPEYLEIPKLPFSK